MTADFFRTGWRKFGFDPAIANWAAQVLPAARQVVAAPGNAGWLRCGGTWFVGVNGLPNRADGSVDGGPRLRGAAVSYISQTLGFRPPTWDRAQVSAVYPGYPRPSPDETEAAYRYRRNRDAAHVDGLLAEGPERRRYVRECHRFVFGVPLVEVTAGTAPLVVWEGSHEVIRAAFRGFFAGRSTANRGEADITEIYHQARRQVFASCRRVVVTARPGECYLLHRLALHGIAPWNDVGAGPQDGRVVAYFRPEMKDSEAWLTAP